MGGRSGEGSGGTTPSPERLVRGSNRWVFLRLGAGALRLSPEHRRTQSASIARGRGYDETASNAYGSRG